MRMGFHSPLWRALVASASLLLGAAASAATGLVSFGFDEGSGTRITDSINSLAGVPGSAANPPMFIAESPSVRPGDTAVKFENGQYFTVEDPDTRMKFDRDNPHFTLQA